MKVKTPNLLKKIIDAFSNKTNELRIRLMIFFLLHKNIDKTSLTHSLQALVSHHPQKKKKNDDFLEEEEGSNEANLLMSFNKATSMISSHAHDMNNVVEDVKRKYDENEEDEVQEKQISVDLTHEIFKESKAEMEEERESEEVVKGGEERLMVDGFVEEEDDEDINQAADLFIQRFKKQMQLQKQRSLERQQQWLLLSNA